MKRIFAILLTALLVLGLCVPAQAAVEDTGFADVAADDWYAGAVTYCVEQELMSGTGDAEFSPNNTMTRAMLATVLYRLAGSPAVTGSDAFTDTADGMWYSDAVLWASQNGIVTGYGDGLFGTANPVTREQIAAILWRYAGSPDAEEGTDFSDESAISGWAGTAVDWARNLGYVGGVGDNRFQPQGQASRAQVAAILMRYHQGAQEPSLPEPEEPRILVAYFSATGNTANIARHIQTALDADLYEIVPEIPYTSADLDYSNSGCRANQEQNDPDARPAISSGVENLQDYDVVFLGYPIWWGQAPKIIHTFLESCDFTGVTIVPFCTSGSSDIGSSDDNLHALAPDADWRAGRRFSGSASQSAVADWVNSLDFTR